MNDSNRFSRPRSGFGIWLDQHLYSFVSSLGRLVRRPWATLLTIGVMAVAFVLPLGLWLALTNVEQFAGDVSESREDSCH
jgi:cell division transport system permease protein